MLRKKNNIPKKRCWNCGKKQPMPILVEIKCVKCGAICMYVPACRRVETTDKIYTWEEHNWKEK